MAKFDAFSSDYDHDHPFLNSSPDYPAHNGSYKSRPIGGLATPISYSTPLSFRDRRQRLREFETEKDKLIDDLIYQLESNERILEQTRLVYNQETEYTREFQQRESTLQEQLRQVKQIMDRDAFVLVLIDGDGTVFTDDLLRKGERGGREAANLLWDAANDFTTEALPHLTSPKIVGRIYINAKGMAENLQKSGVIEKSTLFEDFMRGFNSSKLLFDFVDAGTQRDRVRDKVAEVFRLHLYDCHCHQIVFACSHNNEYAQLLTDALRDPQVADHVALVEGIPFETGIDKFKDNFRSTKFDIFRSSKVIAPSSLAKGPLSTVTASTPGLTRVESNGTSASSVSTPAMTWASLTAAPFVPLAAKCANIPTKCTTPPSVAVKHTPGIERNRLGQRIDKVDTMIPREEIQRIKKLKLCNIYFLQGNDACTSKNCSHDHSYPLSKGERKVLGEVARMTPCYYQSDCDDPECIYGHRCPQSKPGEKECWYKEDCRFWGWGHGIDVRVVKTTRV